MTGVLTGVRAAAVIEVESIVGGDPGRALVVGACSLPSNTVWWRDMS